MAKTEETERGDIASLKDKIAKIDAEIYEIKQYLAGIADALVKKEEAKKPAMGGDLISALASAVGGRFDIESLKKQAKTLAEIADALEQFRRPSRLGVGEALLMRLGVRAAYPRYMTKHELKELEKRLGIWETLGEPYVPSEEKGEEEHVE